MQCCSALCACDFGVVALKLCVSGVTKPLMSSCCACRRDYTDISIAVATPKGLVVPVLRSVDKLSFAEVEKVRGRSQSGAGLEFTFS